MAIPSSRRHIFHITHTQENYTPPFIQDVLFVALDRVAAPDSLSTYPYLLPLLPSDSQASNPDKSRILFYWKEKKKTRWEGNSFHPEELLSRRKGF